MMKEMQKRGRPPNSRDVRVTAEFRAQPDVDKLARAFIAIAQSMAEKTEKGGRAVAS